MSVILSNYNKNKPKPKPDKNGFIQSLPDNSLPPKFEANDCRVYSHGIKTGDITEWKNLEGQLTHFTFRSINGDGKKYIIPFTFHTKINGGETTGLWKSVGWQGHKFFHDSHKFADTGKPLLVVEGEKCMHFANKHPYLKNKYRATTWYGGVEQVYNFNFEPFRNKEVILCPDNDEPGRKCMHTIAYILVTQGITDKIKYLNVAERFPKEFPTKWDIADPLPDKFKLEEILDPKDKYIVPFESVKDDELWEEIEEDFQKREAENKAKELEDSFCYVMANDMFYSDKDNEFYLSTQINNFYKDQMKKQSLSDMLLKSPTFKKAHTFITSSKYPPGLITVKGPGEIPLIKSGKVLNIYVPNYITAKKGDVKFIIDFYKRILGPEKWKVVEQWIAYHLKYPGEKIKFAIVIVSETEGTGKGLLARIISRILGEDNVNENANYKHLNNTHNTLLVGTQVVVLNEISLGDFKSKAEGTNSLKNFVADDYYTCNFKNKPMVKLVNLTDFLLFSQEPRVIEAKEGGRRYFFIKIKLTEEEIIQITDVDKFFDKAWEFVDSDEGAAALLYYFQYEVEIPDPTIFKKRAPVTDDLKELREQSKHPVIKKLEYALSNANTPDGKIFRVFPGIICFDELNDLMSEGTDRFGYDKNYDWGSYGDDALLKFLEGNCTPWNDGNNTRQLNLDGSNRRYYVLRDDLCLYEGKSYKDLKPKQIAKLYKHYANLSRDIKQTRPDDINKFIEEWDYEKYSRKRNKDKPSGGNEESFPTIIGDGDFY